MTITFLNQNSKTFLDIPGQFCDFPRTSQYEIQGYFQDKGSFLGLFLEKSWTILLLLSQNKFLFNLCYYSNNHILLCIFVPPPSPPKKQTNTVGWLVAHNKIKSTKIVVDNTFFLQLKISNKRKKHNIKICGTWLIKNNTKNINLKLSFLQHSGAPVSLSLIWKHD